MGGHARRGQGQQHGVDEFSGPGDDDVLALVLDPGYLGQLGQQPVVEGRRGQEPDGLSAPGPRGQAGRGVQRDDASLVDQRYPVAQPFGFLHEVRDQHDRHAAVADTLDQFPGVAAGLRIQAGGHLVEYRDLRLADERQRDRQPLPLAAGQGPVVVVAFRGEPQRLGQLADVGRVAVERPVHVEDLPDPQRGRQRARLELHPDDLVHFVPVGLRVEAHQPDRARVRRPEPDGALDGGGFARPVRAEDAEDLALGHRERDIVHRDHRPVGFAEVLDLHRRPARSLRRLAGTDHHLNRHLILHGLFRPLTYRFGRPPRPAAGVESPTPPRVPRVRAAPMDRWSRQRACRIAPAHRPFQRH